jgi:hypothetical protein
MAKKPAPVDLIDDPALREIVADRPKVAAEIERVQKLAVEFKQKLSALVSEGDPLDEKRFAGASDLKLRTELCENKTKQLESLLERFDGQLPEIFTRCLHSFRRAEAQAVANAQAEADEVLKRFFADENAREEIASRTDRIREIRLLGPGGLEGFFRQDPWRYSEELLRRVDSFRAGIV